MSTRSPSGKKYQFPQMLGHALADRSQLSNPFQELPYLERSALPKVMPPFWVHHTQILNDTKRAGVKAWSIHPNWEQLGRTTPAQLLVLPNPALPLPFHKW